VSSDVTTLVENLSSNRAANAKGDLF